MSLIYNQTKENAKKTLKLTEYLNKRKKHAHSNTSANKTDKATPQEFQSQFKLFSNKKKELDMKPKLKNKKKGSLSLNQSQRKNGKYVNALKKENPEIHFTVQ